MAKAEKPQQEKPASPRVYKAANVHKRRASHAAHVDKKAAEAQGQSQEASAVDEARDGQSGVSGAHQATLEISKQDASASSSSTDEGRAQSQLSTGSSADMWDLPESDLPAKEAETPSRPMSSDEDDEAGQSAHQPEQLTEHRRRRLRPGRVILGTVLAVVLVAVALGAAFAWNRWGRYDDFADMQGEWYVMGTTVPVVIDATSIHLTDDVAYDYAIDDHAKTISYVFGNMEGQGRYWFSDDRQFFAITDGEGYNGAVTALEDLRRVLESLPSKGLTGPDPPRSEGTVAFCRQPGKLSVVVSEAAERARKRIREKEEREAAREAARLAESESYSDDEYYAEAAEEGYDAE